MNIFQKSDEFDAWLAGLKDPVGKARIALRLDRAARGNFGDCEAVGGDKATQKRDIKRAIEMASLLPED